jgi:hypothetical protein
MFVIWETAPGFLASARVPVRGTVSPSRSDF